MFQQRGFVTKPRILHELKQSFCTSMSAESAENLIKWHSSNNLLFENEETILRDIYARKEEFAKENARHRKRIFELRRKQAEEEERMQEIFKYGIDLWHHRKFAHLKVNIREEKQPLKAEVNQGKIESESIIDRTPPPFLPPLYRQVKNELKRIDFGCDMTNKPLNIRNICMTRYLRLPEKYIPKT
eukprot:TCONS_00019170-protein